MKRELKPSTVLKKALKILETWGWFKGNYAEGCNSNDLLTRRKPCRVCAWGALVVATRQYVGSAYVYSIKHYLDQTAPGYVSDMAAYNDSRKSFSQIRAWFNRAIKLAQAEGK